jgi:uncharacterized membrane protein SpoIIM required for sporulation
VDIDRYLARNQPAWSRLHDLTRRARRGVSRLSPDELDELVSLYQRTSTHLSYARTYYGDAALTARLTALVADSGSVVYGSRPRTWRALRQFFLSTFPVAVWRLRRFIAISALLTFGPSLAIGAWLANSDAALDASAPAAVREAYVEEDFENYYSSAPAGQFATEVFVNNVQVAVLAFAGGILLCVPTAILLAVNGANLGMAAGLFAAANASARFWGLILPHGLLELTAVVVAGAAGLRLGWAVIDPGDRPRGEALAEEGRRSVVVVLGLVAAFAVAGLIEGFVTGSALPTYVRVGIGVVVEAAFVLYVVVQGRAAAARGLTGLLGEEPAAVPASGSGQPSV